MIKKTINYNKLLLGSLLLATSTALSQNQSSRMGSISSRMGQANTDVMSTIQIIRYWVYGLITLFIIIRIIMIISDSGRGEDKIMKAGALFAILIIGAIIIMVAEGLFS